MFFFNLSIIFLTLCAACSYDTKDSFIAQESSKSSHTIKSNKTLDYNILPKSKDSIEHGSPPELETKYREVLLSPDLKKLLTDSIIPYAKSRGWTPDNYIIVTYMHRGYYLDKNGRESGTMHIFIEKFGSYNSIIWHYYANVDGYICLLTRSIISIHGKKTEKEIHQIRNKNLQNQEKDVYHRWVFRNILNSDNSTSFEWMYGGDTNEGISKFFFGPHDIENPIVTGWFD